MAPSTKLISGQDFRSSTTVMCLPASLPIYAANWFVVKKSLAVAVDLKQDAIPMAEFLQQYQHA
jgi:hypothetical protein